MTAASASFAASAAAYEAAVDRLTSHLAWLMGAWQSETATQLAVALIRYITWLRLVQVQLVTSAARTADQAAAFATAYASMAQMVEIVENRVTTAILYATNFLGFNTIPIGVREGQYVEMTIQDITVQETYLAATMANTAFEPFVPMTPIVTGPPVIPPLLEQATAGAARAGDTLMLAAGKAESALQQISQLAGQGMGLGFLAGWNAGVAGEQADARDAVERYRDGQSNNDTQDMANQLVQQAPQQLIESATQGATQALELPQQVAQQVGQPVQQFASQITNLMNQVAPEHQLSNPGFFDTHPSSTTLDHLAGSNVGTPAFVSALRVPSMAGLSGASTGFRFPANWDGLPPPAPVSEAPVGAARPMGSGMSPLSALRHTKRGDEDAKTKRPAPELTPVWGEAPPEPQTESAGQWAAARQESA